MKSPALLSLVLLASACAPDAVQVYRPVPASVRNASMIEDVRVRLNPLSATNIRQIDQRIAERRAAAGLPAVGPTGSVRREDYDTLPFARMLELVLKDAARERGLTSGRPLRIEVEIDTLKTADAGMAIIAGSRDPLAGQVEIFDALSNQKIGQYYVDVINSHSGLIGLAMRGGGIREKLSAEFAGHIVDQLARKR